MAKKYYMVMVDNWFRCQDGVDTMTYEYSGIIHTKKADAEREYKQALKETKKQPGCLPWILEVENG